jgi:hypothetical protein
MHFRQSLGNSKSPRINKTKKLKIIFEGNLSPIFPFQNLVLWTKLKIVDLLQPNISMYNAKVYKKWININWISKCHL